MSVSSGDPDNRFSVNRIQFKSVSLRRLPSEDPSAGATLCKFAKRSNSRDYRSSSNLSEIIDDTCCYHPGCNFAYNIRESAIKEDTLLTECLPFPTYQRLAKLWDLDPTKTPLPFANRCKKRNLKEDDEIVEAFIKNIEKELGIRSDLSEDLQINASSELSKPKSRLKTAKATKRKEIKPNPYVKFLKKTDDVKSKKGPKSYLGKEAGRITKKIINNFLEWYQSLGGNDEETFIEESTLQELFQIGFDMPASKALGIRVKELATVPKCLATLRNEPKHATTYALRQFLKKDIELESRPARMFAFGKMLPKERPPLRYVPPKNNIQKTWMECSRVPKDLDTMKTIWEGLEKLRSTIAFSNWLKNHPEIIPPTYLEEKGLLKINYEEWNQLYKGFEMDVGNLEVVTSEIKMTQDKTSVQELKSVESGSPKFDSVTTL